MSSVDFHVMAVGQRELYEVHRFTAEWDPEWELEIGSVCRPDLHDEPLELVERLAPAYQVWDLKEATSTTSRQVYVIPFRGTATNT
jgi:hypothetical protein